jgi:hypothetical protein
VYRRIANPETAAQSEHGQLDNAKLMARTIAALLSLLLRASLRQQIILVWQRMLPARILQKSSWFSFAQNTKNHNCAQEMVGPKSDARHKSTSFHHLN